MADRKLYRYILVELEKPLDLGRPRKLGMICPTPDDVGLTFVSGDQYARTAKFTPYSSKTTLSDPVHGPWPDEVLPDRDTKVLVSYWVLDCLLDWVFHHMIHKDWDWSCETHYEQLRAEMEDGTMIGEPPCGN